MNNIIELETEFGEILIESHQRATSRGGKVDNIVKQKFEYAVNVIKIVGDAIIKKVKEIGESPDEVSIEIGVKFTAEAGAIIAKTSSEGTIKLNLTWKNDNKNKS